MSTRPPKRGLLDPWREWLKEQRESSNYNASRIWREMVARVSRWLMPWRITRDEENYASRFISLMCEKEPELKIAQQLALEFYRILKT
ncbi:transposase, partial [Escherichia coli O145:NM str. 2010C-3507]